MLNRMTSCLTCLGLIVFIAGCTNTRGVTVRSYLDDRPRVDQSLEVGNAGYVYGSPQKDSEGDRKKTRKIYVVEFSQEADSVSDKLYEVERTETRKSTATRTSPRSSKKYYKNQQDDIPMFDDMDLDSAPTGMDEPTHRGSVVDYTVQKNDTLQKISKKFYNAYSKWPKIYKANKDKLKNPDKLKPGIVLRIPVE